MKQIPNYPGYMMDDNYDVWSFRRVHPVKLKPLIQNTGYYTYALFNDDGRKTVAVHRLLYQMAVNNGEPLEEGLVINHKDGIKTNNSIDNLELVTPQENNVHALDTGLHTGSINDKHWNNKASWEVVEKIRREHIKGDKKFGASALGRKYGLSTSQVHLIIHNKSRNRPPNA